MKKSFGIIVAIIGVIALIAIATVSIIFSGADIAGLNYVRLTVNPQIEFICDGDQVVGVNAINEEAKELCAQEDFLKINVDEASRKFVDLCARAGYIDVDKNNNAVKIDCISGLSQAIEVKVYNAIKKYFQENQIFGAVIENNNDNAAVKEAKDVKVNVDKYTLIESLIKLDSTKTFNDLKKLSEAKILELINKKVQEKGNPGENYTQEELTNKHILIDFNRVKFAKHQEHMTDKSKKAFNEMYSQNEEMLKKELRDDFDGAYSIWKNNHINFIS